MNSQKTIDIHQSSLLSLKAELLRKKQEVHDAKLSNTPIKTTITPKYKLKTKLDRSNEGVSERDRKDAEEIQEESDMLKKSQKVLEAKSKLYDELLSKRRTGVDEKRFLVDFNNKEDDVGTPDSDGTREADKESDLSGSDFDDEEEWIDFVDCLGRTKRCHRDDFESMKENDNKLRVSLFGSAAVGEKDPLEHRNIREDTEQNLPELCSQDMRKEILRQKWEEEERKLMELKDVHYQHVLFDEARSHGVGYYSFSTDEDERTRQMEALKNLRQETVRQQAVAQEAGKRKKLQMAERLRAARRRKRERLGLPPEEEVEEVEEEEEQPKKPEELKREVQTSLSVRPWDIGKDNVRRILTQEEWIEKRREERPKEFAPPRSLEKEDSIPRKKKKPVTKDSCLPEAYLEDLAGSDQTFLFGSSREPPKAEDKRRIHAEIPPPPSLGESCSTKSHPSAALLEMEKSIEEGLKLIRRQLEERQTHGGRAFDVM